MASRAHRHSDRRGPGRHCIPHRKWFAANRSRRCVRVYGERLERAGVTVAVLSET